jgi:hypothetical protein
VLGQVPQIVLLISDGLGSEGDIGLLDPRDDNVWLLSCHRSDHG